MREVRLVERLFGAVEKWLRPTVEGIEARLDALEQRAPSVDGKDGAPGRDGTDGVAGIAGKDGRDGLDGKDGAPGRDGRGIARIEFDERAATVEIVLDDETRHALGLRALLQELVAKGVADEVARVTPNLVVAAAAMVPPGRDGRDGAPGRPGDPGHDGRDGADGLDGKDGRDGFDLDDFEASLTGRTLTLGLRAGGLVVERQLRLDGLPAYRGTFAAGKRHEHGDMVTYGGSVWMARRDTGTSPPGDDWQLVVKGTR